MSSGRKRKNEHLLLHNTQNNHIQNKRSFISFSVVASMYFSFTSTLF